MSETFSFPDKIPKMYKRAKEELLIVWLQPAGKLLPPRPDFKPNGSEMEKSQLPEEKNQRSTQKADGHDLLPESTRGNNSMKLISNVYTPEQSS